MKKVVTGWGMQGTRSLWETCKSLLRKHEGNTQLARSRHTRDDIIKIHFREIRWEDVYSIHMLQIGTSGPARRKWIFRFHKKAENFLAASAFQELCFKGLANTSSRNGIFMYDYFNGCTVFCKVSNTETVMTFESWKTKYLTIKKNRKAVTKTEARKGNSIFGWKE